MLRRRPWGCPAQRRGLGGSQRGGVGRGGGCRVEPARPCTFGCWSHRALAAEAEKGQLSGLQLRGLKVTSRDSLVPRKTDPSHLSHERLAVKQSRDHPMRTDFGPCGASVPSFSPGLHPLGAGCGYWLPRPGHRLAKPSRTASAFLAAPQGR